MASRTPMAPAALTGWFAGREVPLGNLGLPGWKVVDAMHFGMPSRLLLDPQSHLQSGLSTTPAGPVPALSYARLMLAEVLRHRPARLLVLGAGASAIPISVARHAPQTEVTSVDSEWAMERVSRSMFSAPDSIRFVHAPALHFVSSGRDKYEMILVDVFSPSGLVPPELVSVEFAAALHRRLHAGGRMVWNVSFRRSGRWIASMGSLMATLAASSLPCMAYSSPGSARAANALLYHPQPSSAPPGWRLRKFAAFFRRAKVHHAVSPFRWPAHRL